METDRTQKGDRFMEMIVLDIGTSSMRGIIYKDTGEKLFTEQVSYSPVYMEHDWVEQNPDDWRNAMEQIMKACSKYAAEHGCDLQAVSVTSQRSSVIPIGKDGNPLGNAVMWQDKRVLGPIGELAPHNDRIFEVTGSRINPVFSGSKMMWIRRNLPELYKETERLVVIPDFIVHEMTGSWVTDTTYGSRSLLMNLREKQWDDEMLDIFQVEREKLCDIAEAGSMAGRVSEGRAEKTGLPAGIPVISAGGDQQCAALGMGIIDQGTIEISAGTGAYIIAAANQVPDSLKDDIICNTSAIPGKYILESSIVSCASAFNWFLRLCYGLHDGNHKEVYDAVNREMAEAMEKDSPEFILPFFQGRGTPDWNSGARGSIHNLTLGTDRGTLGLSMLESLSFEIANNVDIIRSYIGGIEKIYACGGMVNSPVFKTVLASSCQNQVCTYSDNEATAIGAWMSAAVTLGIYDSYQAAFKAAREGQEIGKAEPVGEKAAFYEEKRAEFKRVYRKIYS